MKTIEGTWSDTRGNLASWGKLHLVLNQDAHVIATSQVAPRSMTFNLDQNGTLLHGSKVWANDELSPFGTYYTATVTASGGGVIWGPQWIIISGSDPVDLTHIAPVKVIPPVDQFSSSLTVLPLMVGGVMNSPVSSELGTTQDDVITVSNQLILAPAGNISLLGSVSQHSMTISIAGPSMPPPTPAFSAGIGDGNSLGDAGPATNQLYLIGGSNITLSGSTDLGGMSISFLGGAGGGDGSLGSAFTAGVLGDSTVANQLLLAGGNNVTLNPSTDSNGMTVWIDGASQGAPGAQFTAGIGGGNTLGGGSTVTNQLLIAGGNNITISRTTNSAGMTMSIIGLSQGTGGTFQAGLTSPNTIGVGGPVSNRLFLAGGNNITLAGTTNASGMTVTIEGEPEGTGGSVQAFAAGLGGGNVSGQLGPVEDRLYLAGGNNITLSGSVSGGSMTITVSGSSQASSHISQLLRLSTGNTNVTLSSTTNSAGMTYSVYGQAGGGTGPGGGGALNLIEGDNITINTTADANGTTATIFGEPAGEGGTGGFRMALLGGGAGTTTGFINWVTSYGRFAAGSNVLLSAGGVGNNNLTITVAAAQASLIAGANITLNTSAGSQGTTYTINAPAGGTGGGGGAVSLIEGNNITITSNSNLQGSTFTIDGAVGGGGGFLGGISGWETGTGFHFGTTMGQGGPVSNQLMLAAGSYMTLSGATNTNGMSVTVRGPKPMNIGFSSGGAGSTMGTGISGGTGLAGLTGGLRLVAGSNVTLSGSTDNSALFTVTINAAGGGGGGGSFGVRFSIGTAGTTGGTSAGPGGAMLSQHLQLNAGQYISIFGSSDTGWGATGVIHALNRSIVAGAGIDLTTSSNSQGLTTTIAAAGAAVVDNRRLANAWPIMPSYTTIAGPVTSGAVFWPFMPGVTNSLMTEANLFMYLDMPGSGTAYGTLAVSLGIYTRNNSTLSRATSGTTRYQWSYSYAQNRTQYEKLKLIRVPMNMNFAAQDYWMAFSLGTTSSQQSFSADLLCAEMMSGEMAGELGAATAHTWQRVPGWGRYQQAGAFPASVAFSQLSGSAATAVRAPLVYLAGFTA